MPSPLADVDALLIDLDGVLYRGSSALPHAAGFVSWLRQRKIRFRLVTNNATLTQQQFVDKLASMAIEARRDEVLTSSLATAMYLDQQGASGQRAYVVGEGGLKDALRGIGMDVDADRPDWVVVGLDRGATYDQLATACLAVERGARFIGTNPDTSLPGEEGLRPGAGALLAAISATTGAQPTVVGKPEPLILNLAIQSLGSDVDHAVMMGDRLDTDIAGAARLGMRSVLVLTGVSRAGDVASSPFKPTMVVRDLAELMDIWPV